MTIKYINVVINSARNDSSASLDKYQGSSSSFSHIIDTNLQEFCSIVKIFFK